MYITYANVLERYPMLKTWAANSPFLNNDIDYAEKQLNGMLATHFSTPFSGAHPTIKDIAIDLVYYRSLILKDPEQAAKIKKFIDNRIMGLKKGDEYIWTDSNTTIGPSATLNDEVWTNVEDYYPTFSMLDPESTYSQIDPDRLDAEEDERS